jgi:hypothetical protein
MKHNEIIRKIRELEQKIIEIDTDLKVEKENIDDSPWEIPSLKETEMRKKIYEKQLLKYKNQLKKRRASK